jgi:uncharacterized protein YqhQ
MRWQDPALTMASLVFIVALIPTVLAKQSKPHVSTSLMNAAVSAFIAVVYLTLSLWFAAATTAINAALWLTLALQVLAPRFRET